MAAVIHHHSESELSLRVFRDTVPEWVKLMIDATGDVKLLREGG